MKKWIVRFCLGVFLITGNNIAVAQDKRSTLPGKVDIHFVGAKTYSEKHIGGVGAKSDNRARILIVYLQLPQYLKNFKFNNLDENIDEGIFTLQDSRGKHYLPVAPSSSGIRRMKNNVFQIYFITPYFSVPVKEHKLLRFKSRIYLHNHSTSSKPISYWLDVPVAYYP